MPTPSRRSRAGVVILVAAAFFVGLSAEHLANAAGKDAGESYRKLDIFSRVLSYVENNYVEEISESELVYGAIEGMLARLDPHTLFMRPDVYRAMKDETTGEFGGIGLDVTIKDESLTVVAPISDTPADRAGILPGDRILKIDGALTKELPLADSTRRLRGPVGSKVLLQIMRDGFSAPQELTLIRDHIRVVSVESRIMDKDRGYVYVKVKNFQDRTDRYLKKALDDARVSLKGEVKGLILDLRNNPGGLLDQAVRISDRFLTTGVIVSTEGRNKRHVETESAKEKDTEPMYPMIVLVNKGSASASEIVAGALQDHGRAVIMGTQTFGKGSVQTVIELDDGSGLKLTIARYYTPKHRSIQEKGITPDVVVADAAPNAKSEDDQPAERNLKNHFKGEEGAPAAVVVPPPPPPPVLALKPPAGKDDDFQLRTAVNYLKAVHLFKATMPSDPASKAASVKR
jgi:carboxyl-terminal processing protease